jgi:hypothetical protein
MVILCLAEPAKLRNGLYNRCFAFLAAFARNYCFFMSRRGRKVTQRVV